jgi:hypothetical protein
MFEQILALKAKELTESHMKQVHSLESSHQQALTSQHSQTEALEKKYQSRVDELELKLTKQTQ